MGLDQTAFADGIRRIVIQQSQRANVGHIGSCLSVADVIGAVFSELVATGPDDPERDRFVLSKGHAALALYAALHLSGQLDSDALQEFCGDGSALGVHPEAVVPGIDFATGSLGHGLSFGAGAALAARLQRSSRRVFVLVSDAECNEGALWEAAMFAAHHGLANLIAIVDQNGQQALGYTENVISLSPLSERWRAFGWDTREVDGHDIHALIATFESFDTIAGAPHVVLAQTTFGKGVSFMENQIAWHYLPMSAGDFARAIAELEASAR